jgi:hypothetical protein
MTTTTTDRARWYPSPAPALDGEDAGAYTDRLTGADKTDRRPYDHPRNRQCSIGYHMECSAWRDDDSACGCPCHSDRFQIAKADVTTQLADGAERLAGLYGLPGATGMRVMALAAQSAGGGADPDREALRRDLETAYGCAQSEDFITDAVDIYSAAATGALR